MHRSDLTEKEYNALLSRIVPIILKKGLKSTTMDIVATSIGMSKRTLYEIFESKSNLLKEVLAAFEQQNQAHYTSIFEKADNVMEAFVEVFKYTRDVIGSLNAAFYRDMDRLYKSNKADYEKTRELHHERMARMYELGVRQEMFRADVDYSVQSRMIGLQMEALKRTEELFPPNISIQRVFDSIILGFLRSIASPKGMTVLDKLTHELIK